MIVFSCVTLTVFALAFWWVAPRLYCEACHRRYALFTTPGLVLACWSCWRADRRRRRMRAHG